MTALEERYRRVLRLLPGYYRRVWEDDMVATFLESTLPDDADDAAFTAEYAWPTWAEVASIAALAVRLRLGSAGGPPRYHAWGAAMRRLALVGLLAHAASVLTSLIAPLIFIAVFPAPPPYPTYTPAPMSWWNIVATISAILWLPAYLALVTGYRRTAQVLAVAAVAPHVPLVSGLSPIWWLLYNVVPILAMVAFHRDSPPVRSRPWLVALPMMVLAGLAPAILRLLRADVLLDEPGLYCLLACVVAVGYLAAPRAGWGGRSAAWSVALALLAAQVLGLRVITLLEMTTADPQSEFLRPLHAAAVAETAVAVAVAAVLAVVARRALRAMDTAPLEVRETM